MTKAFIVLFSLVLLFQGCVQESKPTVTTLSQENPTIDQTKEIPSTTVEETSTTFSSDVTPPSEPETSSVPMESTTVESVASLETTSTESSTFPETTTTEIVLDTLPVFEEKEIPYPPGTTEHTFGMQDVAAVNGKIAYTVFNGDGVSLMLDGIEIARGAAIDSIADINGKVAYSLQKSADDEKTVIVYDGKELGGQYDNTLNPVSVGGKLAYVAVQGNKTFIVYDGNEIGKEYFSADSPADVNGELAYVGYKNQSDEAKNKGVVVWKGDEIFWYAHLPSGVNGKLAYVDERYEGIYGVSVIYGSEDDWRDYANIADIKWIGGKLAYTATEDLDKYFLVYDDKEVGKEYYYVRSPMEYKGKLLYIATLSGPESPSEALIWDGKKITDDYYAIVNDPVIINGKLVFAAEKNTNGDYKWYWVKEK